MILHVLQTAAKLSPNRILVVIPPDNDQIPAAIQEANIQPPPEFVVQPTPQGTADAVHHCLPLLSPYDDCLILSADVPLIRPTVLHRLMQVKCSILVANVPNPQGYGRILFNHHNHPIRIIEQKDCTPAETAIATVNCGIYYVPASLLSATLPNIRNENSSREYYLTDIVAAAAPTFAAVWLEEAEIGQIRNINTPEDLAAAAGEPT